MSELLWTASIFAASALGSAVLHGRLSKYSSKQPEVYSSSISHHERATISKQLDAHVSRLPLSAETKITIWGYHTIYAEDAVKGEQLYLALKRWLRKDVHITYIFGSVDACMPERFANLVREYPSQFEVVLIDHVAMDDRARRIVDRFTLLHPTLVEFDDPTKCAMWVEYNHEANSTEAEDVYFYDLGSMVSSAVRFEFDGYRSQLNHLLQFKRVEGARRKPKAA